MVKALIASVSVFTFAFTYPANSEVAMVQQSPSFTNHDPVTDTSVKESVLELHIKGIYNHAQLNEAGLDYDIFRRALIGYYNMKHNNLISTERPVLSVVDFNVASTDNRFWIIDLKSKRLLYKTLVAHGRGSGENIPTRFSNIPNSYMSSVGFYRTGQTYFGKHGLSLRLEGLDEGFNSKAEERAIVIHGADYVSKSFVARNGRLGRSLGCPALPSELTKPIINLIKDNTVLYIAGPVEEYSSNLLDQSLALQHIDMEMNIANAATKTEMQASL